MHGGKAALQCNVARRGPFKTRDCLKVLTIIWEFSNMKGPNVDLNTSTPQLPFKIPQIPSNKDHKALNRGTFGGLGSRYFIAIRTPTLNGPPIYGTSQRGIYL